MKENRNNTLGKRIRLCRENRNLGVNQLSRLCGINASYISALENGNKQNPSIDTLTKIANALNVTIDELLSNTVEQEENNTNNKSDRRTLTIDLPCMIGDYIQFKDGSSHCVCGININADGIFIVCEDGFIIKTTKFKEYTIN